jgi:hypothetical protein
MSEHDLEIWLLDHPQELGVERWIGRQMRLPLGVLDLLGYVNPKEWIVIELKAWFDSDSSITQVLGYAKQVEDIAALMYPEGQRPVIRKAVVGGQHVPHYLSAAAHALNVEIYFYRHDKLWFNELQELRRTYPLPVLTIEESEERIARAIAKIQKAIDTPSTIAGEIRQALGEISNA